jgi:hypothetical protein
MHRFSVSRMILAGLLLGALSFAGCGRATASLPTRPKQVGSPQTARMLQAPEKSQSSLTVNGLTI